MRKRSNRINFPAGALSNARRLLISLATFSLLTGLAAILAYPAWSSKPPDWLDRQLRQPIVEIVTESVTQKLQVLAKCDDERTCTLQIYPKTDLEEKGTENSEIIAWVRVASFEPFEWNAIENADPVQTETLGNNVRTSPIEESSGESTFMLFRAVFLKPGDIATLSLSSQDEFSFPDGPYVRFSYPVISSPVNSQMDEIVVDNTKSMSSRADELVTIGSINGVPAISADLNIQVGAGLIEVLNSDLTSIRTLPAPQSTVPYNWSVEQRFAADLLFRDARWDRIANIKIFISGMLVALGCSLIVNEVT